MMDKVDLLLSKQQTVIHPLSSLIKEIVASHSRGCWQANSEAGAAALF